jgi:hypothetical protein
MVDERTPLTPEELAELLATLDKVMEDAERLRRSVTRQLAHDRASERQELSPASNRPRRRKQR